MTNSPTKYASITVSVLVAARNEENNILNCLNSLASQNYPAEAIEILIGDDGSTDATAFLIKSFIKDKPQFRYYFIEKTINQLKGKTNVLMQLADYAHAETILFCDADIIVQPNWCKDMSHEVNANIGIVTGVTRTIKGNLWNDLLSMEWIFALFLIKIASIFKIPITAMGNNMGVSRAAYRSVGGYQKIGFSVVEDFALFKAIVNHGFQFKSLFKKEIVSFTEPLKDFRSWKSQRIRWITGVKQTNFFTKVFLFLLVGQFPIVFLLLLVNGSNGISLFFIHYFGITLLAILSVTFLRQFDLLKTILLFWFYLLIGSVLMLWFYFFSNRMEWKGRKY